MKQNVPGYHGVGSAIKMLAVHHLDALKTLYKHSLFFRTLLENSMQALSKSNFKVTRYLAEDPQFGEFWNLLKSEYEATYEGLLELSGEDKLLSGNPTSQSSIAVRENIVLPLIAIQQYALQKLQDPDILPEIADRYRKLVMRAMFGIINAARNAA
jgi:phosphoenolpyruvate carboxylase